MAAIQLLIVVLLGLVRFGQTNGQGVPIISSLVFDNQSTTLTCTSTGGPATNVTWRKDGMLITLNRTTYQQTPRITTNLINGTYQTVLSSVLENNATYSCMVENTRGFSTAITQVTTSQLQTYITTVGRPIAGQSYTFTCAVTTSTGDFNGTLQWVGPGNSNPINTTNNITVNSTEPYTLTFNQLHQSQDGQYTCQAISGSVTGSTSTMLKVAVPTLTVSLIPNVTHLPNVTPYNNFTLTCTATSIVAGVGNVSIPKRFIWRRRYGPNVTGLTKLKSNDTIQIMDGRNLDQSTSTSTLTVTENITQLYRYRCRVDLNVNVSADKIHETADVYPITVSGPSSPLEPSDVMHTGITVNGAIIQWTVSMIAYTPETYTVYFGNTSGSLTPFSSQQHSGDNFTATNLTFSIELTRLAAGTRYYYQVEAMNSLPSSKRSVEQDFTTKELLPLTVAISSMPPSGPFTAGQSYTLNCTASGENLSTNTSITWTRPTGNMTSGIGSSLSLALNPLRLSDAGKYTCTVNVTLPFPTQNSSDVLIINVTVPAPKVNVSIPGNIVYAGNSVTLKCEATLLGGVTVKDVNVTSRWMKNNTVIRSGVPDRVRLQHLKLNGNKFVGELVFSLLSSSDNGTYTCMVNVTPRDQVFVTGAMGMGEVELLVAVPTLTVSLIPNVTHLPNVTPYNTFSLTCTATSIVAGVGNVSLPKKFSWRRQYGPSVTGLTRLYSNETIQIVDGYNLDQSTSTSMLTVTENIPQLYRYRCRVDLNLSADAIFEKADVYPITVSGPSSPLEPADVMHTGITVNGAIIQWTVSMIAYTPETYTVYFGTSGSLTPFSSQQHSGDNFTATNLTFSTELTGLAAGTRYYYQVEATNSLPGSKRSVEQDFTTKELRSPWPVGAIVGAVLVMTVVCGITVGITAWRIRRRGKLSPLGTVHLKPNSHKLTGSTADTSDSDCIEMKLGASADTKTDEEYHDTSAIMPQSRRPIPVSKFEKHVAKMHEDGDKGFELEYNSFSEVPQVSHTVAEKPCNKVRNRYKSIFPYDFSRVKLREIPGKEGSDYINASFLDGYGASKAYIGTQGPLPNSVSDFWWMIWENRLPTVVMLTRCFEGKKKCEQYWPEEVSTTMNSGYNLSVTLISSLPFAEYEIRNIILKDTSDPGETPLEVSQLHYLGWPDHHVPDNALSMVNFIRQVRKIHPPSHPHPLLVHCSAGVGRTGAFIVLDSMMQRIEAEGTVNIFEFLGELRDQRIAMVQTELQYVFIHDALCEHIICGDSEIAVPNLRITMNSLYKQAEGKVVSGFEQQFQLLDQVSHNMKVSYAEAKSCHNLPKNRYSNQLANDKARVRLRSNGVEGSDYINASFIDGYRRRNAYIATQGPLPSTVNDFWQMVWEYESKCIVMLCNLQETGEEACCCYWPEKKGESVTYGKVRVTVVSEDNHGDIVTRKLELSQDKPRTEAGAVKTGTAFTVTHFHFQRWPEHGCPPSNSSLLLLVDNVTKVEMGAGNKALTVLCSDGVGRTGAFICIHSQLERLKTEGVVDIFQSIKSARIQRAGLVQTVEQYTLCHSVLADYVDSLETYANFKDLV